MNSTLENRVAIVTGAGGKTGAAIAYTLAKAGVRVVVNDINPDRAERAAAAIREKGYEAVAITADISNRFQCVNLIESVRDFLGHKKRRKTDIKEKEDSHGYAPNSTSGNHRREAIRGRGADRVRVTVP